MKITPLYSVTVSLPKEVDDVKTRVEDGKTITETVKVMRPVNVPICVKIPSRAEKEEADIERAAWVNKYHERGLMLEAMLIKKYVDEGGTLPKQYQKEYQELQNDLLETEKSLLEMETLEKEKKDEIGALRRKFFDVRERMIEIQRTQSQFFEDTAEAKARLKKIEWIVLNLSYYQPLNAEGSPQEEWVPFFPGDSLDAKLDHYDSLVQKQDPLLMKAKPMLSFLATVIAHDSDMTKEEIEAYTESIKEETPTV